MQKQKKNKLPVYRGKIKTSTIRRQWTEDNFSQLYPEAPQMITSSVFFIIGLNYRGTVLKIKLPTAVNNAHLPYIFHKQIYLYLLTMKESNPLLKTAQVIGFESVHQDLLLDYQISIGKGVLTEKISFNCLEYVAEGRLKKYKICKCLAIGGFSKVYLVRSLRDGQFYAMKVMLKKFISENQKESIIQNQKHICSMLNHPFIVKMNHCFETHHFVCFVLDYCPGGQLFYYLKSVKKMQQSQARFYFIQILYGLMYLHQQNIIYRDLKPQNLLIGHDGHMKIADFGLSKSNMDQRKTTYSFCGSTQYMPPQMILGQGHSYGVDFYTLGALLYELVTGLPPFYSRNENQIKMAIINEQLTFPSHTQLSPQIKNLLIGLLDKNQKRRIGSLKGLKEILFHPWVGRISSQTVLSKKMTPPYIPPIDQFNFDQNQLGQDQFQFTQALLNESMIPQHKQILTFSNFDFHNEHLLRPEVKKIYDANSNLKKVKNSVSAKSLKKSISKTHLQRRNSSPYLLSQSAEKGKKMTSNHNKSLQIMKQRGNFLSIRCGSKKRFDGQEKNKKQLKKAQRFLNSNYFHKDKENKLQNPFLRKKKFVNQQNLQKLC